MYACSTRADAGLARFLASLFIPLRYRAAALIEQACWIWVSIPRGEGKVLSKPGRYAAEFRSNTASTKQNRRMRKQ
jgi:hypothetical protein